MGYSSANSRPVPRPVAGTSQGSISNMIRLFLGWALALLCLAVPAAAQSGGSPLGSITITDAYAPPTEPGQADGAVYFKVRNASGVVDTLVRAVSPAADRVEIQIDDIVINPPPPSVKIAVGDVAFEPGGLHLRLAGLAAPLKEGQTVRLVLTFARGGEQNVEAVVRPGGSGSW